MHAVRMQSTNGFLGCTAHNAEPIAPVRSRSAAMSYSRRSHSLSNVSLTSQPAACTVSLSSSSASSSSTASSGVRCSNSDERECANSPCETSIGQLLTSRRSSAHISVEKCHAGSSDCPRMGGEYYANSRNNKNALGGRATKGSCRYRNNIRSNDTNTSNNINSTKYSTNDTITTNKNVYDICDDCTSDADVCGSYENVKMLLSATEAVRSSRPRQSSLSPHGSPRSSFFAPGDEDQGIAHVCDAVCSREETCARIDTSKSNISDNEPNNGVIDDYVDCSTCVDLMDRSHDRRRRKSSNSGGSSENISNSKKQQVSNDALLGTCVCSESYTDSRSVASTRSGSNSSTRAEDARSGTPNLKQRLDVSQWGCAHTEGAVEEEVTGTDDVDRSAHTRVITTDAVPTIDARQTVSDACATEEERQKRQKQDQAYMHLARLKSWLQCSDGSRLTISEKDEELLLQCLADAPSSSRAEELEEELAFRAVANDVAALRNVFAYSAPEQQQQQQQQQCRGAPVGTRCSALDINSYANSCDAHMYNNINNTDNKSEGSLWGSAATDCTEDASHVVTPCLVAPSSIAFTDILRSTRCASPVVGHDERILVNTEANKAATAEAHEDAQATEKADLSASRTAQEWSALRHRLQRAEQRCRLFARALEQLDLEKQELERQCVALQNELVQARAHRGDSEMVNGSDRVRCAHCTSDGAIVENMSGAGSRAPRIDSAVECECNINCNNSNDNFDDNTYMNVNDTIDDCRYDSNHYYNESSNDCSAETKQQQQQQRLTDQENTDTARRDWVIEVARETSNATPCTAHIVFSCHRVDHDDDDTVNSACDKPPQGEDDVHVTETHVHDVATCAQNELTRVFVDKLCDKQELQVDEPQPGEHAMHEDDDGNKQHQRKQQVKHEEHIGSTNVQDNAVSVSTGSASAASLATVSTAARAHASILCKCLPDGGTHLLSRLRIACAVSQNEQRQLAESQAEWRGALLERTRELQQLMARVRQLQLRLARMHKDDHNHSSTSSSSSNSCSSASLKNSSKSDSSCSSSGSDGKRSRGARRESLHSASNRTTQRSSAVSSVLSVAAAAAAAASDSVAAGPLLWSTAAGSSILLSSHGRQLSDSSAASQASRKNGSNDGTGDSKMRSSDDSTGAAEQEEAAMVTTVSAATDVAVRARATTGNPIPRGGDIQYDTARSSHRAGVMNTGLSSSHGMDCSTATVLHSSDDTSGRVVPASPAAGACCRAAHRAAHSRSEAMQTTEAATAPALARSPSPQRRSSHNGESRARRRCISPYRQRQLHIRLLAGELARCMRAVRAMCQCTEKAAAEAESRLEFVRPVLANSGSCCCCCAATMRDDASAAAAVRSENSSMPPTESCEGDLADVCPGATRNLSSECASLPASSTSSSSTFATSSLARRDADDVFCVADHKTPSSPSAAPLLLSYAAPLWSSAPPSLFALLLSRLPCWMTSAPERPVVSLCNRSSGTHMRATHSARVAVVARSAGQHGTCHTASAASPESASVASGAPPSVLDADEYVCEAWQRWSELHCAVRAAHAQRVQQAHAMLRRIEYYCNAPASAVTGMSRREDCDAHDGHVCGDDRDCAGEAKSGVCVAGRDGAEYDMTLAVHAGAAEQDEVSARALLDAEMQRLTPQAKRMLKQVYDTANSELHQKTAWMGMCLSALLSVALVTLLK